MFKKFCIEIAKAETMEQLNDILYRIDGVDMMYQRDKISWKEHEILFGLVNIHRANTCLISTDI